MSIKKVLGFLAILFSCGLFAILYILYCECARNRVYISRVIPAANTFESIAKKSRGI